MHRGSHFRLEACVSTFRFQHKAKGQAVALDGKRERESRFSLQGVAVAFRSSPDVVMTGVRLAGGSNLSESLSLECK